MVRPCAAEARANHHREDSGAWTHHATRLGYEALRLQMRASRDRCHTKGVATLNLLKIVLTQQLGDGFKKSSISSHDHAKDVYAIHTWRIDPWTLPIMSLAILLICLISTPIRRERYAPVTHHPGA
jgi:hypothetical protein